MGMQSGLLNAKGWSSRLVTGSAQSSGLVAAGLSQQQARHYLAERAARSRVLAPRPALVAVAALRHVAERAARRLAERAVRGLVEPPALRRDECCHEVREVRRVVAGRALLLELGRCESVRGSPCRGKP